MSTATLGRRLDMKKFLELFGVDHHPSDVTAIRISMHAVQHARIEFYCGDRKDWNWSPNHQLLGDPCPKIWVRLKHWFGDCFAYDCTELHIFIRRDEIVRVTQHTNLLFDGEAAKFLIKVDQP